MVFLMPGNVQFSQFWHLLHFLARFVVVGVKRKFFYNWLRRLLMYSPNGSPTFFTQFCFIHFFFFAVQKCWSSLTPRLVTLNQRFNIKTKDGVGAICCAMAARQHMAQFCGQPFGATQHWDGDGDVGILPLAFGYHIWHKWRQHRFLSILYRVVSPIRSSFFGFI